MQNTKHIRKMILCAALIALQIIFSRYLGIQTQFVQTGFGFVPIAVASAVLGPIYGGACALISDFLGVILAGTNAYCPLFSINAVLHALFYAFFLYKRSRTPIRVMLSVILQTLFVSIPLTPVWLYLYYNFVLGTPQVFTVMSAQQILVRLIEIPIKIVVLLPICTYLLPKLEKILNEK